MSRPAAALNPGQTNRRFVLLAVVLGLIGAVLVYVAFSRGSSSGTTGGDLVPVVVAKTDIAARTRITANMIDVKLVADTDRSSLAYPDTTEVIGKVTRFPITANEQVLSNKIVALEGTTSVAGKSLAFVVPPGERAMAVTVKEVVAAGGLVLPGDYVDIIVVYDVLFNKLDPKDPSATEKVDNFIVQTILQNVEVLAVSQTIVDFVPETTGTPGPGGHRVRNSEAKPNAEAVTVTLSLLPEEAQKLYLAESNGRIRLLVRNFTDGDERPLDPVIQQDLWQRNLPNPFIR